MFLRKEAAENMQVWMDNRACGELSVCEQGLYLCCRAVCHLPRTTAPVRLYLLGEKAEYPLGILQPETDGFVLTRRVPLREIRGIGPLLRGELRAVDGAEGEWRPASGELLFRAERLRRQIAAPGGILVCRRGSGRKIAVPYDGHGPFPLTELFCFARICRINGREYAVFAFDSENNPLFT